jgi:cysteine desulfurase/selenocysteine lyase
MSLKSDFPCFEHNPSLVYLDSAATTQKPRSVIDGVTSYVEKDYSNIHRGAYALAQRSEDAYEYSKQLFGQWIGADPECIVYTYNATSAFNLIAQTLGENKILSP